MKESFGVRLQINSLVKHKGPNIFNFGLGFFFLTGTHDFSQDESHTGPTIIICNKIIENTFNCVLLLDIEVSMVREIAIVISSNNCSG